MINNGYSLWVLDGKVHMESELNSSDHPTIDHDGG